jgi:hypothetical protein
MVFLMQLGQNKLRAVGNLLHHIYLRVHIDSFLPGKAA